MELEKFGIPLDIIVNHILPYTYRTKPTHHLQDVRSFHADYAFLRNIYAFDYYNYHILLSDLMFYCNNFNGNAVLSEKYLNIIERHVVFRDDMIYPRISPRNPLIGNSGQKIKFIWGLLTPSERTDFVNTMIIDETQDFHD